MDEEKDKPADNEAGGRGEEPYLTPVQQNKIIGMMVRQQWPVKQTDKIEAVEATVINMASEDGRISNGAVRNLIAMNAQNMEQEQHDNPQPQTVLHRHAGTVGIAVVRQELLNDPAYLEFQRQRAIATDLDAGPVRPACEQGPVEDGPAPGPAGPSANGRH